MIRPPRLLFALLLLAGCRSARPMGYDEHATRYRTVSAALAAHPDLRTRGIAIVDGVPTADMAAAEAIAPRELASVEVARGWRCSRVPADPAITERPDCPLLVVSTRSMVRASEERRRRMGSLRIRVHDGATGRFIAAEYYAVADDSLPEVSVSSGKDGWGWAEALAPGRYRLELFEYPCADSTHLADEAYATRAAAQVLVQPRRRTDVDLRIDVRAVEADTTLFPRHCDPP